MKVFIEFDTEKPLDLQIEKAEKFLLKNQNKSITSQQQITQNNNENKFICFSCGKNLYDIYDNDTVKKIINFCRIKYKIKGTDNFNVFCKDCQKNITGGD